MYRNLRLVSSHGYHINRVKKKATFTSNLSARDLPGVEFRGSLGGSGLTELELLALLANKCFG